MPEAPAFLTVITLGRFAVYHDQQQLSGGNWNRRKVCDLFKLLLSAEQHRLHREQAQEILWPSSTSEQAANSFGKTLYLLRRALEPELPASKGGSSSYVALDHDTILLVPGSLQIDIDLFEASIKTLQARLRGYPLYKGGKQNNQLLNELDQVASLYGGDYLPEDLYTDWTNKRRDRLRRLHCWLLENAATLAMASGLGQSACEYFQALLEHDSTDEQTHRLLMQVYARMGHRNDALNQFHQLQAVLRDELNTEPLPETISLYHDIQAGRVPLDLVQPAYGFVETPTQLSPTVQSDSTHAHPHSTADLHQPHQPAAAQSPVGIVTTDDVPDAIAPATDQEATLLQEILIGREEEMQRLRQHFLQTRQGLQRVCFISGEPGIGKTRLASDFTRWASEQHQAQILQGHCYEMSGSLPYQPLVEALEAHAHSCDPQQLRQLLGSYAGDLAKIIPEIRTQLPDLPPPAVQGPEMERRNLYNAIAHYFHSLAVTRPLVIILDDLQWADTATIQFLSYLTTYSQSLAPDHTPFYLLLYRADEVHEKHPLRGLLATFSRLNNLHDFRLKRLNEPGVQQLLVNAAGHVVDTAFTSEIYRHTEGNPFFIIQVLLSLVQEGKLKKLGDHWQMVVNLDELALPQGVRMLIEQRLVHFSPECRALLLAAAVLGRQFESLLLCEISHLTEEMVAQHLDDAIQAQILMPLQETAGYEGKVRSGSSRRSGDLAFTHDKIREVLYQSLNPLRRRSLHRQTAQAIEALYAQSLVPYYSTLAFHYQMAEDDTRAIDYYLKASQQAASVYAFHDAAAYMEQALALLIGDEDRPQRAELLRQLATNVYLYLGLTDKSLEAGLASCALWRDLGEPIKEAEARLDVAFAFHWQGRETESLASIARALECLEQKPDETHLLAKAYSQWGMTAVIMGDTADALEHMQHSERLHASLASTDPFIDVVLLWSRSWYAYLSGSVHEMLGYARRGAEVCRARQRSGWEPMLTYSVAWAHMLMGNIREGELVAQETLENAQRNNAVGAQAWAYLVQAFLAIQSAQWQKAQESSEQALTIARTLHDSDLEARVLWSRSVCAGWLNNWEESASDITQALHLSQQSGELSMIYPYLLIQAAKACHYAHQPEKAQAYLDQGMQLAQVRHYRQLPAIGKRLQGRILMAREECDAAQSYFAESLQELADLDDQVEYARTLEASGQCYLTSKQPGDLVQGQLLLARAQEILQRLGLLG